MTDIGLANRHLGIEIRQIQNQFESNIHTKYDRYMYISYSYCTTESVFSVPNRESISHGPIHMY